MLRSMDDAVSGMQAHQQWLDVIGNNIANVSTPGFKASNVTFEQLFAQTLAAGGAPTQTQGGVDPSQVGLGVGVGAITPDLSQGALQTTGSPTDLALQGAGYFLLDRGAQGTGYTRVGNFGFDAVGNLVDKATGDRVQGWLADTKGVLPTASAGTLSDITIPQNSPVAPQATSKVSMVGNLDAATPTGAPGVQVPLKVYDSLGNPVTVTLTLEQTAPDNWQWTATGSGGTTGSGAFSFKTDGTFGQVTTPGTITLTPTDGAAPMTLTPDFSALTQDAASTTVNLGTQDGYAAGTLQGISVDSGGVITGTFSNGLRQTLGRVAVATFANPAGLLAQGQGIFTQGNDSGVASVGGPGAGGAGTVVSGSLEGSNVDLAAQFTAMIAAQSGFQANARVVSVDNQILQTLVQLGQ